MPAAKASEVQLATGNLDDVKISVVSAPYLGVIGVLADAMGGQRRGVPEPWRHHVARHVGRAGHAAIRPIVHPGASVAPDCIALAPRHDISVADQLAFLRDASSDVVLNDLDTDFGDNLPPQWRGVAERPRSWLSDYAAAGELAFRALAPLLERGRDLIVRETDRVGAAVVRGHADVLMANLHPRLSFRNGVLTMDDPEPARFDLAGRRLVLVPTLGADSAMVANFDLEDMVWISYPVAGARDLWRAASAESASKQLIHHSQARDPAVELLGEMRARLLRQLHQPKTVSAVAADLNCVPASATYQCDRLVAAGLVQRERRGREVYIARTTRGDALLEILGG